MPINEPKKPEGVVLTEKQKMAQMMVRNILGLSQSQWNMVIFRNDPYVWMQYFCGLALKMPTLIVIRKVDASWIPVLKESKLVKAVFQVTDFKEAESSDIAKKLARYIKQHPEK